MHVSFEKFSIQNQFWEILGDQDYLCKTNCKFGMICNFLCIYLYFRHIIILVSSLNWRFQYSSIEFPNLISKCRTSREIFSLKCAFSEHSCGHNVKISVCVSTLLCPLSLRICNAVDQSSKVTSSKRSLRWMSMKIRQIIEGWTELCHTRT